MAVMPFDAPFGDSLGVALSNETTKPRLGTLASSLITDFSARHEINMNPNSFILREC